MTVRRLVESVKAQCVCDDSCLNICLNIWRLDGCVMMSVWRIGWWNEDSKAFRRFEDDVLNRWLKKIRWRCEESTNVWLFDNFNNSLVLCDGWNLCDLSITFSSKMWVFVYDWMKWVLMEKWCFKNYCFLPWVMMIGWYSCLNCVKIEWYENFWMTG